MDKLRVGIIGCGAIATGKHMPSLYRVKECEMVAFCDLVEEKAQEAAKVFGTPDAKVYTDYKKLLEDKTIDVVHVCTPNRAHSFITVDALEAGKHVMCEKPMAINTAEAQKMLDAAKRTGKKLTIGYQNRYRPEVLYLKGEADRGTFGDIYYAEATALRRRGVPARGMFLNKEEQGGGPLIDIGTHSLDLTLWILNNYKPKYCVGTVYHKLSETPDIPVPNATWDPKDFTVEDSAFGFIVMENGATINLRTSWALNYTEPKEATTLICGTKAGADLTNGLKINGVRRNRLYIDDVSMNIGAADNFDKPISSNEQNAVEQRLWIDSILNDTDPVVLPEQAIVVTKILEGLYTSAETGTIYNF